MTWPFAPPIWQILHPGKGGREQQEPDREKGKEKRSKKKTGGMRIMKPKTRSLCLSSRENRCAERGKAPAVILVETASEKFNVCRLAQPRHIIREPVV
jgi:hypothetical protein